MTNHLAETLTLRTAFEQFNLPDLDNPRTIADRRHTLNRWEKLTANLPVGSQNRR